MSDSWQAFGHNQVKSLLFKQLSGERLAHAYLFSGPSGIGKFTLAKEFSQKILGAENLGLHPDFVCLDVAGEITVEQLRDFMPQLSLKPLAGKKKVAVINNADAMNRQSANALLKTLEEPSESTVIILVGDAQKLPQTIRSRCQILNMQSFTLASLSDFAKQQGYKVSEQMLVLSFGSSSQLALFAQDQAAFEQKQSEIARWQKLTLAKPYEKFLAIADLAELEQEELGKQALAWLFYENNQLRQEPRGFRKVDALQNACLGLSTSQNKKSVLQNLFLKI